MVLKDLAKSGGFFLLGVPKYLLAAKFFILPRRKGLVYHSWHVIQKQQKFTGSTGFFVINNWVTTGPRWNLGKSVRVFFQTRPGPRKTRSLVNGPHEKIELHAGRKWGASANLNVPERTFHSIGICLWPVSLFSVFPSRWAIY